MVKYKTKLYEINIVCHINNLISLSIPIDILAPIIIMIPSPASNMLLIDKGRSQIVNRCIVCLNWSRHVSNVTTFFRNRTLLHIHFLDRICKPSRNTQVSYKKQELLTVREHLGSPLVFNGVRVAHPVSFLLCFCSLFCCVLFVLIL